jgi:hypothetical protein
MCSIEQRLDEIGQAIEDLAVQAGMPEQGASGAGPATPAAGGPADGEAPDTENLAVGIEPDDSSRILARLAELWGLLADLDPEVARRLAGYQALLWPICPTATAAVAHRRYSTRPRPGRAWAQQHRCLPGVVPAAPQRQRCCQPGRPTASLTRTRPSRLNPTTSLTRQRTPSNTPGPTMLPARPANGIADPHASQQDNRHVGRSARRAAATRGKLAYRPHISPDRETRQQRPGHTASQRI